MKITENKILFLLALFALILSGIRPHDYFIWLLEVSWVIAGLIIVIFTHKQFPLTPLIYRLIFIHAIVLVIGGHHTYERVPVGI